MSLTISLASMLIGNMLLYTIFFWLVGFHGQKFFGLETDNMFLYSAYVTLVTLPVAYVGATLINWGLLRESIFHNSNTWLPPLLMGIVNIIALSLVTYFKKGELGLDIRTSVALVLMVAAQLIMRLPK